MTRLDYDLILIESFVHETKQSYFKGKREEFKCDVDEYCTGLKESFDRHNEEVSRLDYYHAIVTTPEGVEEFHVLDKDLSLSEQTNHLWSIGNVTYPNKRTIVLKEEFRKGEIKELTAGMMAVLWVDLEKYLQSVAPVEPQQEIKTIDEKPVKLIEVFETVSKYNFIMELLVKKGHCEAGTYIWKDQSNGYKGLIVAILKNLPLKGYFKENKKLTNDQLKQIALNTFGEVIGIDTVKSTKGNSFDLSFIPLASTIN